VFDKNHEETMYCFMRIMESKLNLILSKIDQQGIEMATQREIIEAARAQQDLIKAAIASIEANVTEVKQLLAANDVAGAQALLDAIQANSGALVRATLENADLTAAVDAVNGDPAPVIEPAPADEPVPVVEEAPATDPAATE
jgi:hypothetical protein